MDSTIIAAIIGAVGTVLAAVITVMVANRKQSPAPHAYPSLLDAPPRKERQMQTGQGPSASNATTRNPPVNGPNPDSEVGAEYAAPTSGQGVGLTFYEVVQAIRQQYPDAKLGRTAEQGQYFDRAKRLTNYQMHGAEPPCYRATQPNGKTMWLYLGKGGKICCGDKE